jgi:hypothetical protein
MADVNNPQSVQKAVETTKDFFDLVVKKLEDNKN